jgi:putative ubiquitin-RnfH superfamily antitoxin RatB of RatAB toxin-antitoxin module
MSDFRVEVVYALPQRQTLIALTVDEGTTVAQAIRRSGLLEQHPDLDPKTAQVGVWGRAVELDHRLRDRDRVEIHRPITADAKEIRRERVQTSRSSASAGKRTLAPRRRAKA